MKCVTNDSADYPISHDTILRNEQSGWGNEDTTRILDILAKHNVHVTFFMTGGWVESFPEDVKAIQAAGHDLGNHSENHKNMSQLSTDEQKSELMTVHNKVKELTGVEMNLFRPPYGDYSDSVIQTAESCGYKTIQWSHNGAKYTADALDAILNGLKEKGYQVVPVSELILRENYHMDVTGKQIPDKN